MPEPTLAALLTRIEILERHVERLERVVTSLIGFPALVKRVQRLEQAATITRRIPYGGDDGRTILGKGDDRAEQRMLAVDGRPE